MEVQEETLGAIAGLGSLSSGQWLFPTGGTRGLSGGNETSN